MIEFQPGVSTMLTRSSFVERVEDLDLSDAARLVGVDALARIGVRSAPDRLAHAVVAIDDARARLAAVGEHIDGRRRRRDTDWGDIGADEGVDLACSCRSRTRP